MPPGWWKWHCTDCGEQLSTGSHNEVRCWSCKDSDPEPERSRSPFAYVPITYRWTAEHRAERRAAWRAEAARAA